MPLATIATRRAVSAAGNAKGSISVSFVLLKELGLVTTSDVSLVTKLYLRANFNALDLVSSVSFASSDKMFLIVKKAQSLSITLTGWAGSLGLMGRTGHGRACPKFEELVVVEISKSVFGALSSMKGG